MAITNTISTATLGFPRIGKKRELKFQLEKYWRKEVSSEELLTVAKELQQTNWELQLKHGVQQIGVGMFSLYDHVLDWILRFGCEPKRFQAISNDLDRYFTMARGQDGIPALDMTKWFNTNYHYNVPEFTSENCTPRANFQDYLNQLEHAKEVLGVEKAVPIVLGPFTFLRLSKFQQGGSFEHMFTALLPIYQQLFQNIAQLGFEKVQVHEPYFVHGNAKVCIPFLNAFYGKKQAFPVNLELITYFDAIDEEVYQWLMSAAASSRIQTIALDFVAGKEGNLDLLERYGFPASKTLGAGLLNGRSIWKIMPQETIHAINDLERYLTPGQAVVLHPSCSLQFLPYTVSMETQFLANVEADGLATALSFACEKLDELILVQQYYQTKDQSLWKQHETSWATYRRLNPVKPQVQSRLTKISLSAFERSETFAQRRPKQLPNLPILPTTNIGSFPQTTQLRKLRRAFKKGELTEAKYLEQIDQQIAVNIGIQEGIGLDILVHGEPERTDMVEFFAEKLTGFAFTQFGWVQSYGSRCVRPPIIFADLERLAPMTVREFKVAQQFTSKPVKGMLTGPVTILNWSFPRRDISRKEQAYQLALCLRDEIHDLEVAGVQVVQVDEPALREGMPLKQKDKDGYLEWAVKSFKLATAVAAPSTSIHTHMCYAEFHDCMEAIRDLDTDVNSIENARSSDETIREFQSIGYQNDLGPGVYDIHSPVVPTIAELKLKIQGFLHVLPARQLVINPDCGLKTRHWKETIPALQHMVQATQYIREHL